MSFQFYYSSINSFELCPETMVLDYFNSTIVQLIVYSTTSTRSIWKNFNSTIVQLIGFIPWLNYLFIMPFQFYYSSINRRVQTWLVACLVHFNSTIVQLIVQLVMLLTGSIKYFNSTIVQLIVYPHGSCSDRCFISILL